MNNRKYTKTKIRNSGKILKNKKDISEDKILEAENVLTYWRTIHSAPINTFQSTAKRKLRILNISGLVSQRLKRAPSIIAKLKRLKGSQLSTMQDIAGIRIVVSNIENLYKLRLNYINSTFKHILDFENNYIINPKESGYRGIHLIYKYKTDSSKKIECDNLFIEVQLRTKTQHIWATTLETFETFTQYSLKSSQGPQEWLDFFKFTSAAFSIFENAPKMPSMKDIPDKYILELVLEEYERLEIEKRLSAYTVAAKHIMVKGSSKNSYNLLVLNLETRFVNVKNYLKKDYEIANEEYTKIERKISDGEPLQAVLVSTKSIRELKKAYPNYFLDSREFFKKIEEIKNYAQQFV